MKRKYAILTLVLPTLVALAILFWSLVIPLIACLSEHSTSVKEYFGYVAFAHVTIFLFNIPAYVWVPLSILGYFTGTWILLTSANRSRSIGAILTGILLSAFPILLLALAPLCKYRGP